MAFHPPGNFRFQLPALTQRRGLAVLALASSALMPPVLSTAGDASSVSSITQREIQRRQQLVTDADQQLAKAVQLSSDGKHEEAVTLLRTTYDSLPDSPIAAEIKGRVRSAYGTASCARAMELAAKARYKEANEVLEAVLEDNVDPHNGDVLKLQSRLSDPDRYPQALTPQHIANAAKVKELLILASSAVELGDYDKANAVYTSVLHMDPYNVAARRGMERIEGHRSEYFDVARDHTRSKQLGIVSSQWEDAVPPHGDLTAMFTSANASLAEPTSAREALDNKLRTLRVPRAEFNGATLDEAMEFLRVQARNLDPQGISFVVNVDEATRQKTISLNLQDVPLEELLRYITQMAGASFRTENNAVVIASMTAQNTSLITKKYRVAPDFIQTAAVDAAPAASDPFAPKAAAGGGSALIRRMGAKEFLESRGVSFPEGGGASFSASTGILIVRTTAQQLQMVDLLVEQSSTAVQKQAKIEVRMVEISQTDMEEHGTDIGIGQANVPASDRIFFSGGANGTAFKNDGQATPGPVSGLPLSTAGLRSSGAITGLPSIEQLISSSSDTPNVRGASPSQFSLKGVFSDPQVDVIFRQISQKKGADVVAVPSVVAKGGNKASIRVVRQFPYPTEFDPPQIPQQVSGSGAGVAQTLNGIISGQSSQSVGAPIVPTTPTAFETKEVGMVLEVEPNISADGRTVEVAVSPSFTEFEGFIDYGSDITNTVGTATSSIVNGVFSSTSPPSYVQPNNILQPVFRRNSLNTAVTVYDGSTIILGGVIEQRSTDIHDKVPMIGDIPLVGHLWHSKVKRSVKKSVLLFVTVTVIDPSGQRLNQASAR